MSIDINLLERPVECDISETKHSWSQSGRIPSQPIWQQPYIRGDLWYIKGVLEGLAAAPINGFVEMVIHEGLLSTTVRLDVYDEEVYYNFKAILYSIESKLVALAAQFPKTHYRVKAAYDLSFFEDETDY